MNLSLFVPKQISDKEFLSCFFPVFHKTSHRREVGVGWGTQRELGWGEGAGLPGS